MAILDLLDQIIPGNDRSVPESARTKRTNQEGAPRGGAYADQLVARLAVDTGAVSVRDGALVIPNRDRVSPVILDLIDRAMIDVVRVVGEMERAREYGRIANGEDAA